MANGHMKGCSTPLTTRKMQIKIITKKNKFKKAKRLSDMALQIAEKRREVKDKGKQEKHTHLNAVTKTRKEK